MASHGPSCTPCSRGVPSSSPKVALRATHVSYLGQVRSVLCEIPIQPLLLMFHLISPRREASASRPFPLPLSILRQLPSTQTARVRAMRHRKSTLHANDRLAHVPIPRQEMPTVRTRARCHRSEEPKACRGGHDAIKACRGGHDATEAKSQQLAGEACRGGHDATKACKGRHDATGKD